MDKYKSDLKVAVVQEKWQAIQQTSALHAVIEHAAQQGCHLIVLSELHNHDYFCQAIDHENFNRAEPIPGPTTKHLGQLAKKYQVVIVGSVFEHRGPDIYHNTAVVLDSDGSLAGCYRKMHIPDDPGYYEKFYFTPGDQNFVPIQTSIGCLGVLICWDQWFPEAARLMALAGADMLIYPTAIGASTHETDLERSAQREAWITIQRSHAIANVLPVICCNRVGFEAAANTQQEEGIHFWGSSFVCDAQGVVLAMAADNDTQCLISTVDYRQSTLLRRQWPFFRDRRIDAYGGITQRAIARD